MTSFDIIFVAIFLVLALGWGMRRALRPAMDASTRGSGPADSIDIDAFENLFSEEDEVFLRQRLGGSAFRKVKRAQTIAKIAYLRRLLDQAAYLIAAAQAGRSSDDAEIRRSAASVVTLAARLRLSCLLAIATLSMEYCLPSISSHRRPNPQRYSEARSRFLHLSYLMKTRHS